MREKGGGKEEDGNTSTSPKAANTNAAAWEGRNPLINT